MYKNPSIAISSIRSFWFSASETIVNSHTFVFITQSSILSSSSNTNAIAANCLLENEWGCTFDGNYCKPPITCCSGRWLNTTDRVNTDQSDGKKLNGDGTETWRIVWMGPKPVITLLCGYSSLTLYLSNSPYNLIWGGHFAICERGYFIVGLTVYDLCVSYIPWGRLQKLAETCVSKKCKVVPLQAWGGPEGDKVVSLTHRPPLPPGNTPGTHFR